MSQEKDRKVGLAMMAGAGIGFGGVVIGWVSGAAIYASAYPVFQSNNLAAWVQAIGTIAAIYWAGRFAETQWKRARRDQSEIRINELKAFSALSGRLIDSLKRTCNLLKEETSPLKIFEVAEKRLTVMRSVADIMAKTPLFAVPVIYVAVPWVNVTSAIYQSIHLLEEMHPGKMPANLERPVHDAIACKIKKIDEALARAEAQQELINKAAKTYDGFKSPGIGKDDI